MKAKHKRRPLETEWTKGHKVRGKFNKEQRSTRQMESMSDKVDSNMKKHEMRQTVLFNAKSHTRNENRTVVNICASNSIATDFIMQRHRIQEDSDRNTNNKRLTYHLRYTTGKVNKEQVRI